MEPFNRSNLQNIKDIFEEKTGVELESVRRTSRRSVKRTLLTAAVVTCFLSLTCYAAATPVGIGDFFKSLFSARQENPLSTSQTEYISHRVATIGDSVTRNGYTVTVKGALTDGTTAHILVDIVAPDGIDLESITPGFDLTMKGLCYEDQHGINKVGASFRPIKDYDGQANTYSMVIEYKVETMIGSNFTLADGRNRTMHLADIWYVEDEYPYSFCHVAEGPWVFNFAFTAMENKEVELLQTPIFGSYSQISGKQVEATIHSVLMKGLSVTVYYTLSPDEVQEAGDFGALRFLMKDGSEHYVYPSMAGQTAQISNDKLILGSGCHYCTYVFETPINYEDVDTLYIGDTAIKISHQ